MVYEAAHTTSQRTVFSLKLFTTDKDKAVQYNTPKFTHACKRFYRNSHMLARDCTEISSKTSLTLFCAADKICSKYLPTGCLLAPSVDHRSTVPYQEWGYPSLSGFDRKSLSYNRIPRILFRSDTDCWHPLSAIARVSLWGSPV